MTSPLTKEDKTEIDKVLKLVDGTKKELARAKQAGLDIADYEQRLVDSEKKLRAIKQAYFPPGG